MQLALKEAEKGIQDGNYPCGAVLTIDNKIVGKAYNKKEEKQDRISHAEMLLYIKHSKDLKKAIKEGRRITMYTTLEPCLMCFGAAIIHRVCRIVASSPDPLGNMSLLNLSEIGTFYKEANIHIEYGLLFDDTYRVIKSFLEDKDDQESKYIISTLSKLPYLNNNES